MNFKKYLVAIALLLAAYTTGRFSGPSKVEIKEVEKIVYRESETKDRNLNSNETSKETRLPDGTVIIEKIKNKEYETRSERNTSTQSERILEKKTEARPNWHMGVVYEPAIMETQAVRYTGLIERRIMGEFYIGLSGSSEKTVGLSFSLGL